MHNLASEKVYERCENSSRGGENRPGARSASRQPGAHLVKPRHGRHRAARRGVARFAEMAYAVVNYLGIVEVAEKLFTSKAARVIALIPRAPRASKGCGDQLPIVAWRRHSPAVAAKPVSAGGLSREIESKPAKYYSPVNISAASSSRSK